MYPRLEVEAKRILDCSACRPAEPPPNLHSTNRCYQKWKKIHGVKKRLILLRNGADNKGVGGLAVSYTCRTSRKHLEWLTEHSVDVSTSSVQDASLRSSGGDDRSPPDQDGLGRRGPKEGGGLTDIPRKPARNKYWSRQPLDAALSSRSSSSSAITFSRCRTDSWSL